MTKKGHQKFSTSKLKFFLKKVIRKLKMFVRPPPQSRRQVSAHGGTALQDNDRPIRVGYPFRPLCIHYSGFDYIE